MKPQDLKDKLKQGGSVFGTMINFIEGVRWAPAFSSKALDYVIIDLNTDHTLEEKLLEWLAQVNQLASL
ncbi:MAG: hypothetical protein Ct9H90mP2_13770 [Dehalococcoidia bacterium]|nr:MAG: hypothetical protein Ct9H90mP2_13770 [Dehalococcoidia bacterium]